MLKFRPISYADSDLRAVRFSTAATAVLEGHLCYIVNSDVNTVIATPVVAGLSFATLPSQGFIAAALGTSAVPAKGVYFPIYREDPDIENVGATINAGDYCTAFALHPGTEFEVHSSAVGTRLLAFTAVGQLVTIGGSAFTKAGRFCDLSARATTAPVVGLTIGTFNATWLRIRAI